MLGRKEQKDIGKVSDSLHVRVEVFILEIYKTENSLQLSGKRKKIVRNVLSPKTFHK